MTKTVHICLLSEQPTPNLCPLIDHRIKANQVIFVVTPQQTKRLDYMKTVLSPRCVKITNLPVDDAYNYEALVNSMEAAIEEQLQQGNTVLVNASGGTKPMAIAAHMAGFMREVPVYYIQNDTLYWLNIPEKQEQSGFNTNFALDNKLNIKAFLQAHGYQLVEKKPATIPPEQKAVFQELATTGSFCRLIPTLNYLADKAEVSHSLSIAQADYKLDKPSQIQAFDAMLDRLAGAGLLKITKGGISFTSAESRDICKGLWLEDFCFDQLNQMRVKQDTLMEVYRSVQIEGAGLGKDPVNNELDVLVLYRNQLHIIESKTRKFKNSQAPDLDEALYKLHTLTKNVAGSQGKAMLVCLHDASEHHHRRAAALGINLLAGSEALKNFDSRTTEWLQGKNQP